jgi:hypothetical protein
MISRICTGSSLFLDARPETDAGRGVPGAIARLANDSFWTRQDRGVIIGTMQTSHCPDCDREITIKPNLDRLAGSFSNNRRLCIPV